MGQVVIGSAPSTGVFTYGAPLIELQQTWGDGWFANPQLEFVSCTLKASSVDPGKLIFTLPYGPNVKLPQDSKFNSRTPQNIEGWYVRLSFYDQNGKPQPQFVGIVEAPVRELFGTSSVGGSGDPGLGSGQQTWEASDPLRTLQKIIVSTAIFYDADTDEQNTVDWIPAMNKRDKRGIAVGNVSDADDSGGYFYGGTTPSSQNSAKWTRTQYANYILENFVTQDSGPTWYLVGQTDVTDAMNDTLDFPQAVSAAEILKMLIDPRDGIDWSVQYSPADDSGNAEGFQVNIFALSGTAATFGGATMPANPNVVSIQYSNQIDLSKTTIATNSSKKVDMVKVLGKRIVVCGTLYGENAPAGSGNTAGSNPDLVAKWSSTLESAYKSAGGGSVPQTCDAIRKQEQFRDVYQLFGVPSDYDLDGNGWVIATDHQGELLTSGQDYQTLVLETLSWIPLKQGMFYGANPPTDNTGGEVEPEVSAPLVFLYDELKTVLPSAGYIKAENNGNGVAALKHDMGVFVHSAPNHRLALNQFSMSDLNTTVNIRADGKPVVAFDWTKMMATVAIESDHRVAVVWQVPSNLAAGDGSVNTIEVEDAEIWVVTDQTVCDVDNSGNPVYVAGTGNGPLVLRNDIPRLNQIMAGVISRYTADRARAKIVWKTFQPWGQLVGSILDVFQQGDDTTQVNAVITSITWRAPPGKDGGSPEMEVNAGYT
jgi:hypothetical protein